MPPTQGIDVANPMIHTENLAGIRDIKKGIMEEVIDKLLEGQSRLPDTRRVTHGEELSTDCSIHCHMCSVLLKARLLHKDKGRFGKGNRLE